MLNRVASVNEGGEVFDWYCATAMAIDDYGQVDHGLDHVCHFFSDSEVSEFQETLPELREGKSDAIIEF